MANSRYDEVYEFRMAEYEDIPAIMEFLAVEWKKGHILSYDKKLFEYEYYQNGKVNMMLAIHKERRQIEGLLGFIYASEDTEHRDAWGSMWKIRDGNMLFLGVEILQRLLEKLEFRTYLSPGIDMQTTGQIVKKSYPWIVGRMKHWYRLGEPDSYQIAVINRNMKQPLLGNDVGMYNVKKVDSIIELESAYDFSSNMHLRPYKDRHYIQRRYFGHPVFAYDVYTVSDKGGRAGAFLVTRDISVNGAGVVRLVDFVGDRRLVCGIGQWLDRVLAEKNAEYIDFYEYGFEDSDLRRAGFTERTEDDDNIIPNYFSPFEQRNVEIYFHAPDENVMICKADGDQDRPN